MGTQTTSPEELFCEEIAQLIRSLGVPRGH